MNNQNKRKLLGIVASLGIIFASATVAFVSVKLIQSKDFVEVNKLAAILISQSILALAFVYVAENNKTTVL